jgi:hypothetical protein
LSASDFLRRHNVFAANSRRYILCQKRRSDLFIERIAVSSSSLLKASDSGQPLFLPLILVYPHPLSQINMNRPNLPPDQDGYHRLATLMTRDESLAIFRRYNFVNIISLLSLQAEIQELQADFLDQCRRDKVLGRPFSASFKTLREDVGNEQNNKLKVLRERVIEYSMWCNS